MNNAKATVVGKCFALANSALQRSWTFHNATEALFWFRSVLKIEPDNAKARLGSARAYQYLASQPWWHNDVAIAKSAAAKALALVEHLPGSSDLVETREQTLVRGQIYSAIGRADIAERYLSAGLAMDPRYSVGHYFLNFNRIFIHPGDRDTILSGLNHAVEIAEAEGHQRRLAAALYFKGFANTLFANYHEAIKDLNQSMTINPGYGAANLALVAAAALARRNDAYKAVRSFKERYPNFSADILDYMWADRSSCPQYHRLVEPMTRIVKEKLAH